jgi:hypothetical protein
VRGQPGDHLVADAQIQLISGHESKKSLEVYQHLALNTVEHAYQEAVRSDRYLMSGRGSIHNTGDSRWISDSKARERNRARPFAAEVANVAICARGQDALEKTVEMAQACELVRHPDRVLRLLCLLVTGIALAKPNRAEANIMFWQVTQVTNPTLSSTPC